MLRAQYTSMDQGRKSDLLAKVSIAISVGCLTIGAIAFFGASSNTHLGLAAARNAIRPAIVGGASMLAPRGCASSVVRRSPGLSMFSSVSAQTQKTDLKLDWTGLKSDLASMIKEKQCGPIMIRLSWHDAGTYCKADNSGGARGAQRFEDGESKHGANAGLDVARDLLAEIQAKYPISAADLWAFASLVATEVMGGPKIAFRAGRDDIPDHTQCVEEGRLPDGDKGSDHLRSVFGRMGFSDKDIVVLSGAHTVGKCHADRSGFDGAWTEMPLQWDNAYFKNLLSKDYKSETTAQGNPQYRDGDVIALETDLALTTDPEFRKYTELFANDLGEFNKAYAETYQKLQELGWESKGLTEIAW
eukprot:CAMPEP_0114516858 /NCGR_PEP_ID=MMETSP0109-20121206/17567_1 /TAXON_ID=29199 /ORGANISM="Chlorarachnion reptans, Strain CCCM449" /LENGTH=358 /DNA_ID=CAMNT_0001697305 /DNA_START=76 /DNA_END=1152 /DNA_ORIENTATION=-